jgi:hypothetical protein
MTDTDSGNNQPDEEPKERKQPPWVTRLAQRLGLALSSSAFKDRLSGTSKHARGRMKPRRSGSAPRQARKLRKARRKQAWQAHARKRTGRRQPRRKINRRNKPKLPWRS